MSPSFIQTSFVLFLLFYCSGKISTLEHGQWSRWEADKHLWSFSFQVQHLALWIQEHGLDLSGEMCAMALCQSSLSGPVGRLVIVGFLYELWLLAVYLHLLGSRDHGLHFFQCFLNSFRGCQHRVAGAVCLPLGTIENVPCPCFEIQRIPLIVKLCSHLDEFAIMLVYA